MDLVGHQGILRMLMTCETKLVFACSSMSIEFAKRTEGPRDFVQEKDRIGCVQSGRGDINGISLPVSFNPFVVTAAQDLSGGNKISYQR